MDYYAKQLEAYTETVHHDVYPFIDPKQGKAQGKFIVITGAGRGIGKAIAKAFLDAGAQVIILISQSTKELREVQEWLQSLTSAAKIAYESADISKSEVVEALFAKIATKYGTPDVLVNNAGIVGKIQLIADVDTEDWWSVWETNLKGAFLCTREQLKLRSKGGCILNITSVGGLHSIPTVSAYQGSKSAIIRLTQYTDLEYGNQGVKCIALHPGSILTTLCGDGLDEEWKKILIDTVELPAATAVYLTSPASDFLKGRYVSANWDMEELEEQKTAIVEQDLLKMRLLM